ncbi:hypothetical protein [Nocardioides taihuensis]|uniref:Uncharacterized protein n=1 Tax=Nocardioides taihuensis TaxID=1835606 RepID=A0ABW0BM41_9ACTN
MTQQHGTVTIYVGMADEGVDVWRPVAAQEQRDSVYRIVEQPYDRVTEKWQFEPGDVVTCERRDLDDGPALIATALAAQ